MDKATTGYRPERNRVTPAGDIVAIGLRGAWTGNRGILHSGHDIVRFHTSDLWITCALEFRGWRMEQWERGHYTPLFFHDEAVSFAAGHRPCALCRRQAYEDFRTAWVSGNGGPSPSAVQINRTLHAERLIRGTHRRRWHRTSWADLPDGAFAFLDGSPALVLGDRVYPWSTSGYGAALGRPLGPADALTPPSTLAVLAAGYRPQVAV